MLAVTILGISIFVQFFAATLALRLIWITEWWRAWSFIAIALTLMGLRRLITFYHFISGHTPHPADLTAELVALSISVFMVSGVLLIGSLFKHIKQSEKRFNDFANASSDWYWETDRDQQFTAISGKYLFVAEWKIDNIIGKRRTDIINNQEELNNSKWSQHVADLDAHRPFKNFEFLMSEDEQNRWVSINGVPRFDSDGKFHGYRGTGIDITERKQVEEELNKLSRAVESSPSAVIITSLDGTIEYVNPKFSEITGYTKEESIGQNPRFMKSGETPDTVHRNLWDTISSGGEWKGEMLNKKKDGSFYHARESITGVKDGDGIITHYISIQDDVTHEFELTEQLSYQVSHDALTGLINRYEFDRRIDRLLSTLHHSNDEHAMFFMDLDQFKVINDTCGHTAGDELLRQLSKVMKDVVRQRDTLARLGGDEFGVLMEYCSLDQAQRVGDNLLKCIKNYQFTWEGQNFRIGISIGLVAINQALSNKTELLKQADSACYMAKDLGRNRIHVYHSDDTELALRQGKIHWVGRINQALEENRFRLYAQPIVSLDNSNNEHYELLLRMVGEGGESIPPGDFLPAAEQYDLIGKIDAWVIQNTFSLLAAYPEFIDKIHFISINLSGPSLTDGDFLNSIMGQFRKYGINPSKICFEVTETVAISNLKAATTFISILREMGCRFALDDFGSGLSSFGYLKNLPVDYLKIDGIFVKDMIDDPIDYAMVKSINEIGHVMGMQTIAEFVENDETKDMLKTVGVNYVQGYGVGKPLPFDEILDLCKEDTDKSYDT